MLVPEVGELAVEPVSLLGGQPDCLLGLLNLSSESSDFIVPLLDEGVEPLALLAQNGDLVLELGLHSLPRVFSVSELLPVGVQLSADSLELSLKFVEGSCRQSKVLLCASDLIAEGSVLAEQLLDLLFVGIDLLGRLTELVSVVVELGAEALCLLG